MFYFNPYAIPFLITAALFLFLGVYVLRQAVRSAPHISFFAICLGTTLWLGSTFLLLSSKDPVGIMFSIKGLYVGVSLIPISVFAYSSLWLGFWERQKWGVAAGCVCVVFFTALIWFTPWIVTGYRTYRWGSYSQLSVYGGGLYLGFFAGYVLAFFRNLLVAYRHPRSPLEKRQTGIVLIGFIIAYVGLVDFLPCYGIDVFPTGAFTTLVLVCCLGFTIIRYKLLNIETMIHKTIMWFTSSAVAVLPFAALIYLLGGWLRKLPQLEMTLCFVGLAMVFYFYFQSIQPRLDQLFHRRHSNLQAALNQFSEELVHLKNLRALLQRFARLLRRTVYVKKLSVFLRDDKKDQFVPAIAKGIRGLKPFNADQPFVHWLERHNAVVISDLVESDPAVAAFKSEMGAHFSALEAAVAVPFVLGGKLIGIVHLGRKDNFAKYTAEEIDFLSRIQFPLTIAFSNSRQFENVSILYKQVQAQNERLKEFDRLKSEFLANTSHELRTPLNGILGLVESILDGADGPVNELQHHHLGMIIESGTNLKDLISNLLELSRIESGQERIEIKPCNVLNVIDAVVAITEGMAKKKGLALRRVVPASLPDIYCDPAKVQRVMINLIGNAIKFTEKGEVLIRVVEGPEDLMVSVEDTGIGIAPEDREIIFERFRQVDGSTTRKFEGTGLGLSIAREIVRLHGGDIRVESEAGRGSRFSFALSKKPVAAAENEVENGMAEKTGPQPAGPSEKFEKEIYGVSQPYDLEKDREFQEAVRGQGQTILLIEDNPVNREVIRLRLEMNNYRVVEAVDGFDGLEKVAQDCPDLVILDLMMPRMSGYEFCKRLRQQYTPDELPIIVLTAKTEMGDKIYGLRLGANDYISKPFHKEELMARVSVLLRIRHLSKELRRWNQNLEKRVDERTRELVKTQEQLIQAEKLATIGTLAGGIAHEINNPLTAVLTNAQILKMSANSEDIESISLIEEGAKRCQLIIQKLMKYARKLPHEAIPQRLELGGVIRSSVSMLQYQLKQENVDVVLELAPESEILGVANELEQVFTNLLLNSRDAVRSKGGGVIRITTSAGADGSVVVQVSDNGIGISRENLGKIFDPFFTTKEVGMGTGLGLAVTYSILEKHECRVKVESEEGAGATFFLNFPGAKTKERVQDVQPKAKRIVA